MRHSRVVPSVVLLSVLSAQNPADSDDVQRVGQGVTAPRLIHKIEPEYSPEAEAAHVQGTVILQMVVSEKGRAIDISVISPLGFGLEERAITAVEKWEFVPGMKGGKPVKILATVEVNFRFSGLGFDEKFERQRSAFNVALATLNRATAEPKDVDRAVQSIMDLSRRKFPAAMHLAGLLETKGELSPRTRPRGST